MILMGKHYDAPVAANCPPVRISCSISKHRQDRDGEALYEANKRRGRHHKFHTDDSSCPDRSVRWLMHMCADKKPEIPAPARWSLPPFHPFHFVLSNLKRHESSLIRRKLPRIYCWFCCSRNRKPALFLMFPNLNRLIH